jgi:hypothetical protein
VYMNWNMNFVLTELEPIEMKMGMLIIALKQKC